VIAYDVDLKSDSATVLFDPKKVSLEKLKQAIAEAGYRVRSVKELDK
jgi:copper chaperone CopZ